MYTHSHTPSHLHVCTPELSEGVRHKTDFRLPRQAHKCSHSQAPFGALLCAACWKESLKTGTPRLWLQPHDPSFGKTTVLEALGLSVGGGWRTRLSPIYQVLLWPRGLMWLLWAAAEGQGLMEGTRKAPFVLGTRACGVGWAWLGRRQYLSIGCITLWPFCRGFPSAKIVQIKLVDNKVADDSLTSLPSVAPPPRPPPPPSRSSLVGAVGLSLSCHLCFPLSRLRGRRLE